MKESGLGSFRPKLICVAVASCFTAGSALANPTGHTVVHGHATVKEVGNLLKIRNSPNAVINWQSFSIGANEITRFIQQSRNSAVMNRVTGTNGLVAPSEILGTLKSNGKVYLLNSAGVLFGAGSRVDVAGLVASSLKLSDSDFQANLLRFTDGAGAGKVENYGNITTGRGGEVYLVGSAVTNGGVISSPEGHVVLAAGKQVELVNPGTPDLRVEINAPDNELLNLGDIVAESGRIGIYAGLINNSGTIRADSAVAEGGKILLKATKAVTLESSSVLDASGAGGGTIEVLAKNGGTVNVDGRLDASAPRNGDGGFIETSADTVKVADGTVVTTKAARGETGVWLIDPVNDYRIGADGDISGAQLSTTLNSTSFEVISDNGGTSGSGDIYVEEPVTWSSNNRLTLLARNNIFVDQEVKNTGSGSARFYAGWDGNVSAPMVVCCGSIYLDAPVTLSQSTGELWLVAGGGTYQDEMGRVTADRLRADGQAFGVYLDQADNRVNTIAGRTNDGQYLFRNARSLTIGSVGGRSGIGADGGEGIVVVDVVGSGNNLTVSQPVTAESSFLAGVVALSSAEGDVVVNGDVTAMSAYGGIVGIQAGGSIAVNNAAIKAQGTDFFSESSALVGLKAGGSITATNSDFSALAGPEAPAIIGMDAGTNLALSGGQVLAESQMGEVGRGPTIVAMRAGNNVTVGGNITSNGGPGSPGWLTEVPFFPDSIELSATDATGIAIQAGNRIIGGNGILDADSSQQIGLIAVNGIGAAGATPAPVRIRDDDPDLFFQNTGSAGDLAVSFVMGDVKIDDVADALVGTHNANPNGTYFVRAEAGNVQVHAPFKPGVDAPAPLLAGQSVTLEASGNVEIGAEAAAALELPGIAVSGGGAISLIAGGSITSTGSLTGGAVSAKAGGNILLSQSESIALGRVESTASNGTVTVSTGGTILDGNPDGFNIEARNAVLNAGQGVEGLEIQVNNLSGSISSGAFNVVNSGDLNLLGLHVGSGNAEVQSTALMQVVGPVDIEGGNLRLLANNGVVVGKPVIPVSGAVSSTGVSVSGDLEIHAGGGDLGISETSVSATNISLAGKNIFIGFAESILATEVKASNLLKAMSDVNFNVLGGASPSASSVVKGNDVDLTVGGVVNIHGGAAFARIESVSPETITLTFPNRSSGGFFVNGVENALSDGDSGFFANAEPAVLGQSLKVTYGIEPPPPPPPPSDPVVEETADLVVANINQLEDTTDPLDEKKKDKTLTPTEPTSPEEEKETLPVCK
jgi:filamentous hemagglutinin family protein